MSDDLKAQMERRYANSRSEILQRVRSRLQAGEVTVEELVRLVIRESYWRAALDVVELDVPSSQVRQPIKAKLDSSFDVSGHR